MSRASKAVPRPRSGIPKPKPIINAVQKRRSAPPDGFVNHLEAVFQQQKDDDKYLTKRVILHARKTGQLNLSGKGLSSVPKRVWSLEEAEEEIKRIDQTFLKSELDEQTDEDEGDVRWWERKALTVLDLSSNRITEIPLDIKKLEYLTSLDLHDNSIDALPEEIGTLGRLEKLDISHNQLKKLPKSFYDLGELRTLSLAHNKIQDISEDLGNLYRLETLDLSHNDMATLPLGMGFLTALIKFDVSHNHLSEVPPELSGLMGLTQLILSHNELTNVPPLGELRKLQLLHLQDNRLEAVPDVTTCSALRELSLSANQIKEIPGDVLQHISHLRVFNLRENKIEEIPEEISHLQSLVRLDLANNNIEDVPSCVGFLPQLQILSLEGNPLKKIRQDMLHCGSARLLRMLRGQSDPNQMSPRAKINLPRSEKPLLPDKYRMRGSRAMSLGMQGLQEVPDSLFDDAVEAEVESVDLCKNLLTSVPVRLPLLAATLTELNLSDNRLSCIPEGVLGACKKLHYIDLQQNALCALPDDLAELTHLREINFAYNKFSELPRVLGSMPGLEIINARDNKVSVIDALLLATVPRLAVLDLANNDINQVPPELGLLSGLRSLSLEGNTFRIPRHEVLAKGTACVLSYLRDRIPAETLTAMRAQMAKAAGVPSPELGADPPRQNSYTSQIVFG
ncbi:leucine-rich repeat-containing protein 40 [Frankliniella occidentalis]|uniref:Leucine-rich repeat-containing protein 40 n=1 Tax=Frankliniella occidentalis TaxID=133901 RepID=A0A6J1T7G3_FRAOC|nr:leucine-rich repeat-containing protein 40 [Frankliniella occidentalis]XP_026287620.1 leucine-rich repeat-containing protein 40 [Frankliniella occidentalis]